MRTEEEQKLPWKMGLAVSLTPTKFAPLLYAGDLPRAMERAAQFGYDGIELHLRDADVLDQEIVIIRMQEFGLEIPLLGTGQSYIADRLSLADIDPMVQEGVRERLRGYIRFAAKVGARVVLGSIRGVLDASTEQNRRAGYLVARDAVRELAEYGREACVELIIEPINRYETNFLNTIEETLEFIDAIGAPNVGLLADTFHMNIEEASMIKALMCAGNLLRHVHMADSNRCAPGMGHTDFTPMIAALRQLGYRGYASAEILPSPDDDTAARNWINAIHRMATG